MNRKKIDELLFSHNRDNILLAVALLNCTINEFLNEFPDDPKKPYTPYAFRSAMNRNHIAFIMKAGGDGYYIPYSYFKQEDYEGNA